jgi:hypothetical protein
MIPKKDGVLLPERRNAMKCPEHNNVELREEQSGIGRTGFCQSCLKNWPLCDSVLYMAACQKVKGHKGLHEDRHGKTWDDNDKGVFRSIKEK